MLGVGAPLNFVVPVSESYQFKVPVAVAVRGLAVTFWQYETGAVTGAAGFIKMASVCGIFSQFIALFARTLIVPELVPTVTLILFVVELPV